MSQNVENLTHLVATILTLRKYIWPIICLGEKQKMKIHPINNGTVCCFPVMSQAELPFLKAWLWLVWARWCNEQSLFQKQKSAPACNANAGLPTDMDMAIGISFLSSMSLQKSWCTSALMTHFSPALLFQKYIICAPVSSTEWSTLNTKQCTSHKMFLCHSASRKFLQKH